MAVCELKLCEYCKINKVKSSSRRFCSNSCSQKAIIRFPWLKDKNYPHPKPNKGKNDPAKIIERRLNKTYIEIYGENKANDIQERQSIQAKKRMPKGTTWGQDTQFKVGHKAFITEEGCKKISKKLIEYNNNEKIRERKSLQQIEYNKNLEVKQKQSKQGKKNWENPQYVKKVRTRHYKSNLELKFEDLCKEYNFPFKFVGDFQLNIGRKFPDFWDGNKKLVELFGFYHIKRNDEKERIEHYNNYGYKCLILWASDINKNKLEETIKKIKIFIEDN